MADVSSIPFRRVNFMSRDIAVERRADGTAILRARHPLQPYARHVPALLERWARETPDNLWLAQRRGGDRAWHGVTYAEGKRRVDRLTQALLDLGDARPVMILAGNSLEHAFMTLAAMQARLPAAPVSTGLARPGEGYARLRHVYGLVAPGVLLVQDGPRLAPALTALDLAGVTVVHVDRPAPGVDGVAYADWERTPATEDVARSTAAITPATIGKLLFTSGSTGAPKAVLNTQEMMTANVAMACQANPAAPDDPRPTVLDWLPWNHTMGGNAVFNWVLADGGALHIDDGRPLPGQFEETLRNLREISTTHYTNVPAGYAALVAALEADEALCRPFFARLRSLAYGGANLSDDLYARMQALAVRHTGRRVVFTSGWGSTETASLATATYWETERVGLIGLPLAGVELKLVPAGGCHELRVRGVNVTPGYHRQPAATAAAFDEEGFYRTGGAGTFVDPGDPSQGLLFAGRLVENFKLDSGSFVHVGPLCAAVVEAAAPVLLDVVVAGHDRSYVGLLAWLDLPACRRLAGLPAAAAEALIRHPAVLARLIDGLAAHNAGHPGASVAVARVLLMADPPAVEAGEVTDKGHVNQRAVLERRADRVAMLFAERPGAEVIVLGERGAPRPLVGSPRAGSSREGGGS